MISAPNTLLTNATSNVGEPNKHSTRAKQAIHESRTSVPEAADKHFSAPRDTISDYYPHIYIYNLKTVFARFNFYFGSFRKGRVSQYG